MNICQKCSSDILSIHKLNFELFGVILYVLIIHFDNLRCIVFSFGTSVVVGKRFEVNLSKRCRIIEVLGVGGCLGRLSENIVYNPPPSTYVISISGAQTVSITSK